uniref:Ig-like domain-containing protein n=1 Tax=Salvator merianae TaxID=96440 RepID=A0A8D0C8A5_SALMN
MPQALAIELSRRPHGHFPTGVILQLLTCAYSLSLCPTLLPPVSMEINGERKTLVVCMVNDFSEDALGAIWFSNGNGSLLESFPYRLAKEEDGTFSTISQISISTEEFESWDTIACYVSQNHTSGTWSNTSLQISGEDSKDPCMFENKEAQEQTLFSDIQLASQILLLSALRILLFKFLLSDVLMTCCMLYKRTDITLTYLNPPVCYLLHPPRDGSTLVDYYYGQDKGLRIG